MSFKSVDLISHPTYNAESTMISTEEPTFTFLPLGAILQRFQLDGLNLVQNFPTAELYQKYNDPYFGETIGRVANRISGAKINSLNGTSYPLAANNGPNSLHGGRFGWGKRVFEGPISVERNGKQSILFKYLSRDGEEGYPGSVEVRVYYTTSTGQQDGRQVTILEVEYEAELVGDDDVEETVVAMTNHRYEYCLEPSRTQWLKSYAVILTSMGILPLKAPKSHFSPICIW
jgi:aldose 1-epimerase